MRVNWLELIIHDYIQLLSIRVIKESLTPPAEVQHAVAFNVSTRKFYQMHSFACIYCLQGILLLAASQATDKANIWSILSNDVLNAVALPSSLVNVGGMKLHFYSRLSELVAIDGLTGPVWQIAEVCFSSRHLLSSQVIIVNQLLHYRLRQAPPSRITAASLRTTRSRFKSSRDASLFCSQPRVHTATRHSATLTYCGSCWTSATSLVLLSSSISRRNGHSLEPMSTSMPFVRSAEKHLLRASSSFAPKMSRFVCLPFYISYLLRCFDLIQSYSQDQKLKEKAREAFHRYGGEPEILNDDGTSGGVNDLGRAAVGPRIIYSSKHDGLYVYLSRQLRTLWQAPLVLRSPHLESVLLPALDKATLQHAIQQLLVLQNFIQTNGLVIEGALGAHEKWEKQHVQRMMSLAKPRTAYQAARDVSKRQSDDNDRYT